MEKMRRLAKGGMSELFGEKALLIDEFMVSIDIKGGAKDAWENQFIPEEVREEYQAFADGVNDYVRGVSLTESESQTGRVLPLEFIAFGITHENYVPWEPTDSLACVKLMNFGVTWDWSPSLHREALRQTHPDLEAFMEDIYPFT